MAITAIIVPPATLLILNLVHILKYAAIYLEYPYELDYGEGIVWQQMRNIVVGDGYAPLGVYPAIIYHYPPVYHLFSAGISSIAAMDQLMAGRLLSFFSTLFAAAMVALLTAELVGQRASGPIRLTCTAIASLLFLSCNSVILWSGLMRVDMLSCALSLGGLALCTRCIDRPAYTIAAGMVFTLAIYAKQTSVAAPMAAMIGLVLIAPRQASLLFATCLFLGLSAFGWLMWNTNGEFIHHTVLYNVNRLYLPHTELILKELYVHFALIILGAMGVWNSWRNLKHLEIGSGYFIKWGHYWDKSNYPAFSLFVFLLLKTLMMPMMLKSGSNINYMIEWFCAISPFAGVAIYHLLAAMLEGNGKTNIVTAALVMLGLPLQIGSITNWHASKFSEAVDQSKTALDKIVIMVRHSPKPVISDKMTLLIRAGQRVEWEPAIAAELGHAGIYDERSFAALVRRQTFGFFITEGTRGNPIFDSRYNPAVADAIDAAYPRKQVIAGLVFHFPVKAFTPPSIRRGKSMRD